MRREWVVRRFWDLALIVDVSFLAAVVAANAATSVEPGSVEAGDYLLGSIFLLAAYVYVPVRWLHVRHSLPTREVLRLLGLKRLRVVDSARGVGLAFGLTAALLVVGFAMLVAGVEPDSGTGVRLGDGAWPVLVVFPIVVGVSEEVFFRGFLQRYLGWAPQAVLFMLLHLPAATPLHLLVPLAVGLGFGYLVHRGASLWVPITAHVTFDAIQLLAGATQ